MKFLTHIFYSDFKFRKKKKKNRQRPTLPHLKMKYHRRWKVSLPSSEWDRVGAFRKNHRKQEYSVI